MWRFVAIMSSFHFNFNSCHIIELYVKSLKEGSNCGFDPSMRKLFIKSLLPHRVLEPSLEVG